MQDIPVQLNAVVQALHDLVEPQIFKQVPVSPDTTALLLIDIQHLLRAENYRDLIGLAGLPAGVGEALLQQVDRNLGATLHNIQQLLVRCRVRGIRPIHIGLGAHLADGSDTGLLHTMAGVQNRPGMREIEFLPETAPLPGEIVLRKTCSGIHVGTGIDRLLRNLHIDSVIVTGFYTDQCISTSVRDLADLNYRVILPIDAVGALSPERHANALQSLRVYASTESTQSLLDRI